MKRTTIALQPALMAAGARPCAHAYGKRWMQAIAVDVTSVGNGNTFGTTGATALGRPPR